MSSFFLLVLGTLNLSPCRGLPLDSLGGEGTGGLNQRSGSLDFLYLFWPPQDSRFQTTMCPQRGDKKWGKMGRTGGK